MRRVRGSEGMQRVHSNRARATKRQRPGSSPQVPRLTLALVARIIELKVAQRTELTCTERGVCVCVRV